MFSTLFAQTTRNLRTTDTEPSGAMVLFGLVIVVLAVLSIIGMWKMFVKAGKPGWAALLPIYNTYILLQIAGKPAWWLLFLLLSFIPLLGFFIALGFSVVVGIEVAKRFGKSEAFGAILCGLLGIGYLIIGFGDARYEGNELDSGGPTAPATPPAA
jgi:hypothetical protein